MLRRSPRAVGLWVGAAALAVTTGAIVAGDLATLHRRARAFGGERRAVVATHDLALGTVVTPDDLTTKRVYSSQLPRGVLGDPATALGRTVRVPVVRDAFVAGRNLAPHDRTGLDGVLPTGTRAMRIVVDNGLRPPVGSAVDVFAAFAADDGFGTGRTAPGPAALVASGVLVLAADEPPVSGAAQTVAVTVLVDEEGAADLAYAAAHGALVIALVPPEDARSPAGLTRR